MKGTCRITGIRALRRDKMTERGNGSFVYDYSMENVSLWKPNLM